MRHRIPLAAALATLLVACAGDPATMAPAGPPKADLQFVDLQGFDRELSQSLSAPLPRVEVAFYDRITPSALPERLQQWMAAVESKGGKVTVVPPPGTDCTCITPASASTR